MRIAIFGTGAVGGYFGGRLAEAGADVSFIARGEQLNALRREGLRVTSPEGDLHLPSVRATDDPAEIGPVDIVLVGVKAWQVSEAAEAIRPMIGPATAALPLQNGVEAARQLAESLGVEHALGGLCKIAARIASPGHIVHMGVEPWIGFGELDNRRTSRVEDLRTALDAAVGVRAEIPPDIQAAIWEKFLFIVGVSGIGAVTRVPIGTFRALRGTREMLREAMEEVCELAAVRGVGLDTGIVEKTLDFIDGLPEGATASMQRDIAEGRPSELEYQNGAVVRLGGEVGVATPLNRYIYHSLLPQERRARRA